MQSKKCQQKVNLSTLKYITFYIKYIRYFGVYAVLKKYSYRDYNNLKSSRNLIMIFKYAIQKRIFLFFFF